MKKICSAWFALGFATFLLFAPSGCFGNTERTPFGMRHPHTDQETCTGTKIPFPSGKLPFIKDILPFNGNEQENTSVEELLLYFVLYAPFLIGGSVIALALWAVHRWTRIRKKDKSI